MTSRFESQRTRPTQALTAFARRLIPAWFLLSILLAFPAGAVAGPDVVSAGRENWLHPWVPDLRKPGRRIAIRPEKRIDVVILPDGYFTAERAQFGRAVEKWYARFLTFPAWGEFRGAFRVRGLWTPSEARFCFWCEEILVAKTLHRTGQLGDSTDGEVLWKKREELRPFYQKAFNVPARIAEQNRKNAQAGVPGSPLLERPR